MAASTARAARPTAGRLVVVTGLPASGKTSVARRLAKRLGLPVFAKDDVKEQLHDALVAPALADAAPRADAETRADRPRDAPLDTGDSAGDPRALSRALSRASNAVLFAVARAQLRARHSLVIESNLDRERDSGALAELCRTTGAACAQVVCHCPPEVLVARFRERMARGARHASHDDAAYLRELEALAARGPAAPLDLPGACFAHDTTRFDEASLDALARAVADALDAAPSRAPSD
ncbi:MAG: AAA family ATPase [Myxococcota bacterium]